jgi:hypothetical protein
MRQVAAGTAILLADENVTGEIQMTAPFDANRAASAFDHQSSMGFGR